MRSTDAHYRDALRRHGERVQRFQPATAFQRRRLSCGLLEAAE